MTCSLEQFVNDLENSRLSYTSHPESWVADLVPRIFSENVDFQWCEQCLKPHFFYFERKEDGLASHFIIERLFFYVVGLPLD